MSDINIKIRAEALGKSLDNLSLEVEAELQQAIKDLAYAAHAGMVSRIQKMPINDSSRKDYLSGLKIKELGDNEYLIFLDGEASNRLEEGQGSFSIRDLLLKSTKIVQVGSRAGQPWVRKSKKDQHKYAAVPFSHHPHRQGGGSGDLATDIKKLVGVDQAGNTQRLTKVFKDLEGRPRHGKVATVQNVPEGMSKNLEGLVKFQHVHASGKVSSVYMTWRMVSEAGKDWVHPGTKGYHLFKEAEEFVEKEMDNIIGRLIK